MVEDDKKNNGRGTAGDDEIPKSNILGQIAKPGDRESIPGLVDYALAIAKERGFSQERIDEVSTALRAALMNIIEHSYKEKSGEIVIVCKHDNWDNLVITMVDTGRPSNILLADTTFPGEEDAGDAGQKAAARVIKKMVDNIEYKRVEQENTLTFTVSRPVRSR